MHTHRITASGLTKRELKFPLKVNSSMWSHSSFWQPKQTSMPYVLIKNTVYSASALSSYLLLPTRCFPPTWPLICNSNEVYWDWYLMFYFCVLYCDFFGPEICISELFVPALSQWFFIYSPLLAFFVTVMCRPIIWTREMLACEDLCFYQ